MKESRLWNVAVTLCPTEDGRRGDRYKEDINVVADKFGELVVNVNRHYASCDKTYNLVEITAAVEVDTVLV